MRMFAMVLILSALELSCSGLQTSSTPLHTQSRTREIQMTKSDLLSCGGVCKVTLGDGSVYKGTFKEGLPHGEGSLLTSEGDHYVGHFVEGIMDGEGVYSFASGSRYTGDFREGQFFGSGVLSKVNGDKYVGEFEENQFHGKGILSFFDRNGEKKTLAGMWSLGRFDEKNQINAPQDGDITNPEVVLFYQYQLLSKLMGEMAPSRPGITDLYFLSFGGDSHQDVFMNEAFYTKALFDRKFGLSRRSLQLINHPDVVHEVPIASVMNLRVALKFISQQMDVEEDILFLYLTSHGSRDHTISVWLGGVPLVSLPADVLSEVLEESGIKWKVVTISACYSGGFIDHLKDDRTMVITSARRDRSSFGCGDDSEMTYFGRAFFEYALDRTNSFTEAFTIAKELVGAWEVEGDFPHSEPQIYTGPLIEQKLKEWRKTLNQRLAFSY